MNAIHFDDTTPGDTIGTVLSPFSLRPPAEFLAGGLVRSALVTALPVPSPDSPGGPRCIGNLQGLGSRARMEESGPSPSPHTFLTAVPARSVVTVPARDGGRLKDTPVKLFFACCLLTLAAGCGSFSGTSQPQAVNLGRKQTPAQGRSTATYPRAGGCASRGAV